MIDFKCPNCSSSLQAPVTAAGKRGKCSSCQQTFTVPNTPSAPAATWTAVDEPKPQFSFARLPIGLKFGLPVLGCLLLYAIFIISTADRPKPQPLVRFEPPPAAEPVSTSLHPGDDIVLQSANGAPVVVAPTAADWDEFGKTLTQKDEDGYRLLIAQGRLLLNASGTPAKYLSYGFEAYEVRIKGGKHDGKSGWVRHQDVIRADAKSAPQPATNEPVVTSPLSTPPVPVAGQPAPAKPIGPKPVLGAQPPAVGVAPPTRDLRSKWVNDTYKDRIVRRDDTGAWQEVDSNTGAVIWEEKETSRTQEYVEVFCPKRSYEIRIFADRMELKKDGKWTWVANGRWADAR